MASSSSKKHVIILFSMAIATIAMLNGALAKEYTVGDDKGWRLDVNYTDWVHGKEFFVGDTLVFKYNTQFHNVINVTEAEYQACNPSQNEPRLTTGNDVIKLVNPGNYWFLCGFPSHCTQGQKLTVLVQAQAPAPEAMPPPGATATPPPEASMAKLPATLIGSSGITFSAVVFGIAAIGLFL
ncbi:Cupredoxins domain-containing protein [Dioscorea alata]|uniref:Cupredoxins domain-containing protein n=1 Tax=Dioscorea alata TaxID=55571 RepID=A0ACB7VY71_DIOAL|nr:Cupredoxins domain-containing protein [Dioscorea alata]